MIDATHKCVSRVKQDIIKDESVKSVHTLWIYELLKHPEGLTATELAAKSMIDRSLISREIRALEKAGYIVAIKTGSARRYNAPIVLTATGKELAEQISRAAHRVQDAVSENITKEELSSFYSTLEKIYKSLDKLTQSEN